MEWSLAIVVLGVLAVASVSGRIAGTPVTAAMLFVVFGLLVGPRVLNELDLSSTSSTVGALAEATLALVLFSDASRINPSELRREAKHGFTAAPLADRYARWYDAHARPGGPSMEGAPATVTRPRGTAGRSG